MTARVLDVEYKCSHCESIVLKIEARGCGAGAGRLPREDDPMLCDGCNGVSVFKEVDGELVLIKCIVDFLPGCIQSDIRNTQILNAGLALIDHIFGKVPE